LGIHGFIVFIFHVTGLRNRMEKDLDEYLLGWLFKITKTSYWLDVLLLLMAESLFEVLICTILGFASI
jgi:hypothetical protein